MISKLKFSFLALPFMVVALMFTGCDDDDDNGNGDNGTACTYESDPECYCDENPDAEECGPDGPPAVEMFSPNAGPSGTNVTVEGMNLAGATVTVGGVEAEVTSSTNEELSFTVPSGVPGSIGVVEVSNEEGSVDTEENFYVGTVTLITNFDNGGMIGADMWIPYGDFNSTGNDVGTTTGPPAPISGQFMYATTGVESDAYAGLQVEEYGDTAAGTAFGPTDGSFDPAEILLLMDFTKGDQSMDTLGVDMGLAWAGGGSSGDVNFNYDVPIYWEGWRTVAAPLDEFSHSWAGGPSSPGSSQDSVGVQIEENPIHWIKVAPWGGSWADSPITVYFDNVRFVELE